MLRITRLSWKVKRRSQNAQLCNQIRRQWYCCCDKVAKLSWKMHSCLFALLQFTICHLQICNQLYTIYNALFTIDYLHYLQSTICTIYKSRCPAWCCQMQIGGGPRELYTSVLLNCNDWRWYESRFVFKKMMHLGSRLEWISVPNYTNVHMTI